MNGKSELKAALNAIDMVRDNYPSVPWADGDDTVVADRVGRATASGHSERWILPLSPQFVELEQAGLLSMGTSAQFEAGAMAHRVKVAQQDATVAKQPVPDLPASQRFQTLYTKAEQTAGHRRQEEEHKWTMQGCLPDVDYTLQRHAPPDGKGILLPRKWRAERSSKARKTAEAPPEPDNARAVSAVGFLRGLP